MEIKVSGAVPFRIVLELETVDARSHVDARRAAEKAANAIEQLRSERPNLADLPLVHVRRVEVEPVG